jgi:Na+/H+ antiporter NhaC
LLPSLVAIVLAIGTRQILLSLFVAIWVGAAWLAFAGETPAAATTSHPEGALGMLQVGGGFLWRSFWNADHGKVLLFSLLFGAMVGSLEASGALRDVVRAVARFIRGRRSGQSLIAVLGLGIFFDDYANTLLLGGTMRTTCDTFRISRAKRNRTPGPVVGWGCAAG